MALSDAQKARLLTVGQAYTLQNRTNTENTIKTVKVNNDALAISDKAVNLEITVAKKATANEGYAASYELKIGNTAVGDAIDIPKDWLLTGVTKGTVVATDKAEGGKFEDDETFAVGDRYIDMEFNVKAGSKETSTHIYLNVQEFIDLYTAGNGLQESSGEFSVKISNSTANGLFVDANGVALALAAGATTTYVAATGTYVSGTTYYTDNTGATTVDTSEFEEGVTDVSAYYVAHSTLAQNGAMSGADKAKLDGMEIATSTDIQQLLTDVYGA